MKKIYFLLVFLINTSIINTSYGQDSIRNVDIGITLSFLSWNKFYDTDLNFSTNLFKSSGVTPMFDFVLKIPVMKKSAINVNLNNILKINETKGGIPYKMDYLTFSPLFGRDFFRKKDDRNFFIGIGPYFGYLIGAKKGEIPIDDYKLRNWDYGLELMINTYDEKFKRKWNFFNFYLLKYQLGFKDVFYFKTMSCTISLFGFIY